MLLKVIFFWEEVEGLVPPLDLGDHLVPLPFFCSSSSTRMRTFPAWPR